MAAVELTQCSEFLSTESKHFNTEIVWHYVFISSI